MPKTLLLTKETRAGETRVALIPSDVKKLIAEGHVVFVEKNAGEQAGFSDKEYRDAGAAIRELKNNSVSSFQEFFNYVDIIVRAKRPDRSREILENKTITPGTMMIGALDPLEKNSEHISEYEKRNIIPHSIDQLKLAADDPRNLLSAMSQIAGRLAVLDAIKKFSSTPSHIVIIGYGAVGRSAFDEAQKQKLSVTVILTNPEIANEIKLKHANAVIMNSSDSLSHQQEIVKNNIVDADIVITSARKPGHAAPLLIPLSTLKQMKKNSVIVDMALSEGGNVEGSEHDATLKLGNEIIVTNTSGYPKAFPREASVAWSRVTTAYILSLFHT